jgi:hypothetical protein
MGGGERRLGEGGGRREEGRRGIDLPTPIAQNVPLRGELLHSSRALADTAPPPRIWNLAEPARNGAAVERRRPAVDPSAEARCRGGVCIIFYCRA